MNPRRQVEGLAVAAADPEETGGSRAADRHQPAGEGGVVLQVLERRGASQAGADGRGLQFSSVHAIAGRALLPGRVIETAARAEGYIKPPAARTARSSARRSDRSYTRRVP